MMRKMTMTMTLRMMLRTQITMNFDLSLGQIYINFVFFLVVCFLLIKYKMHKMNLGKIKAAIFALFIVMI